MELFSLLGFGVLMVAAVLLYRRWRLRRALWGVVGVPAAFLFKLARVDGPVNEAERAYIHAFVATFFEKICKESSKKLDPRWLAPMLQRAEKPLGASEEDDYIRFLGRHPEMAWQFFDVCCGLAQADGPLVLAESRNIDMVALFSMLPTDKYLPILKDLCPDPVADAAAK